MKKSLYIVFLLLSSLICEAQNNSNTSVWILGGHQTLTDRQVRVLPDISFDGRQSFYDNQSVKVGGLRLGVKWNHVHSAGIGFYFLNNRVFDYDFPYSIAENKIEYELNFASFYYERVLYFNKKWELASAYHLGAGTVDVFHNPGGGNNRIQFDEIPIYPTELTVKGSYNIFYWLTAGVGVGYRAHMGANGDLRKSFNSPTYVLNINVKVFKLVRSFFDNSVKDEY